MRLLDRYFLMAMEFPQFKHQNTIKVKKKNEVIGVRIDIPTQAVLRKKKQNPKKQNQKTALKPHIFTGPNMISYPILASP